MVSRAWARAKVDSEPAPTRRGITRSWPSADVAPRTTRIGGGGTWPSMSRYLRDVGAGPEQERRRQYLALALEATDLLRSHREQCGTGQPTGPDDPVWPKAVSPGTFRRYRQKSASPKLDAFGMRFSAHSFLVAVYDADERRHAAKMVDVLMRHTGR